MFVDVTPAKKDCDALGDASSWNGTKLAIMFNFGKGVFTGAFELAPDGTLVGDFKTTKMETPLKKTFYRVK
jgi:hypothetical protein